MVKAHALPWLRVPAEFRLRALGLPEGIHWSGDLRACVPMIGTFLSWLAGGGIAAIGKELRLAQQARLNAQNEQARLEADQNIAYWQGQMQLAQAAAANDKWWSTRELIGKCVLLYVAKIVVWDTVLKLGVTPDPGPQVTGIVMVVIGFYFGSKAVSDIGAKLIATFAGRK